jgi:hypothetical protein
LRDTKVDRGEERAARQDWDEEVNPATADRNAVHLPLVVL